LYLNKVTIGLKRYIMLNAYGVGMLKKLLVFPLFVILIIAIFPHTANADSIAATISLAPSMDPVGIAFDPSNGYLYVTDGGSTNVSVIDGSTNMVIKTITVQLDPIADVYVPSNGDIYVANFHSDSISVIDASTNTLSTTITSINSPRGLAFDPANGFLYVTNAAANTVTVIDTTTNTVTGSPIAVGNDPHGILFDPANNELYVVNNLSNDVTVIDATTNTVVGSPIPVGTAPLDAERDPVNGHIFVTNTGSNDLTVIDSSTNIVLVPSVPLGGSPRGLIFDPSNGALYVASLAKIIEVNPAINVVIGNIPLGPFESTAQFAFDSANGDIYVTNQSDDFVFVISPSPVPTCIAQSSITSNFNGNSIAGGNYIWFNSVLKLKSPVPSSGTTIFITGQTITSSSFTLKVPDAKVIFSPSATKATTSFDTSTNTWITTVPASFGDNVFMSGLAYQVPSGGLPGGINPVTWSGTFSSSQSLSVQWQWGAAVYTNFSSAYNSLGVKPVHSTSLDMYPNGDQAGTPENFKSFVTGGARGGGGSNWTGSYSSTASVSPSCK
jgi:YVTN family beta-propeller protein